MLKDYLFSNWVLIWYILYKIKLVKYAPVISGILATFVYVLLCTQMNIRTQVYCFLLLLHIIIPIDLIYLQKNPKYNLQLDVLLFLIYNIYIGIRYNKNFYDIYINDLPAKFDRNPDLQIVDLFKLKKNKYNN